MQEHSVDLKLFVRQVFLVKSLCMVESLKSNWSISFLKPQFSCCMPICFLHSGRFRKDFAKFAFCRNHEQTESVVSKFMLLRWAVERLPQRHFPQQVPFKSDNVSRGWQIQMMELCFLVILMSHILEQLGIAPSRRSLVWIPTNPLMQFKWSKKQNKL